MCPLARTTFLLDGATGTELDRRGVDIDLPLWSAQAITGAPDVLRDVHRAYLEAGADAITTNTFRTHERSLEKAGLGTHAEALTHDAVAIARDARDEVNPGALVMGSVAPLEDCYQPGHSPDAITCRCEHGRIIAHLIDAGVDLVLIETMTAAEEALAAVDAAKERAAGAWAVSFCLSRVSAPCVLLDGTPLETILPRLKGARFIGLNCVSAPELAAHVGHLRGLLDEDIPIAAYGNVGHADTEGGWVSTDAVEPERFASCAMEWIESGACVVGGCCGTTPETIAAINRRLPVQTEARRLPSLHGTGTGTH